MQVLRLIPKVFRKHKIVEFACKMKLHDRLNETEFNEGSKAFLDLLDPEPRNIFIRESFEPDFFRISSAFVYKNGCFFDLGANHGLCSFGLLPNFPSLEFHIFEANEFLFNTIKLSTTLHPRSSFFINHACLSDQEGTTRFHVESAQSGQSHVATDQENGIEIKNLLLDKYCDEKKIDVIEFAKIDLEGHELSALKGWSRYLKKKAVRAIYIEIMPENQKRYSLKTNAPLKYLESFGYELYLCKEEDFGNFGEKPKEYQFESRTLNLSRFKAQDFPNDFATDVLALASENHKS
jgi:FkbM family methyltransferase